jgi:hypothetical protein
MANITYKVTRWDLSVHQGGDEEGKVCRVILGITATDSVSGKSAYKDESMTVHPCVALDEFNTNAEQWIENTIGGGGWYLELQTRIASQLTAPVPAPAHEHPNFAAMTIGDGYSELPSEEEEEAEVVEETPASDAPASDEPVVEEAPKAAKKKAKKKEEEAGEGE